jgi:hypothetical protein
LILHLDKNTLLNHPHDHIDAQADSEIQQALQALLKVMSGLFHFLQAS